MLPSGRELQSERGWRWSEGPKQAGSYIEVSKAGGNSRLERLQEGYQVIHLILG